MKKKSIKEILKGETVQTELFKKVVDFYRDNERLIVCDVYKIPHEKMVEFGLVYRYRVYLFDKINNQYRDTATSILY